MKILFVADVSIHQVIGGAERVLFEQATRLSRWGHHVHVMTRALPDHPQDREEIGAVQEWRYQVDSRHALSYFRSTLRNGRRLFESLEKKINFDCIAFHQPFSALSVVRSGLSAKIPKLYVCHSLAFEEYVSRNPRRGDPLNGLLHFGNVFFRKQVERRVLQASDPILVLSRFTREKLWRAYRIPGERVRIIPGGVDTDRFSPTLDRRAIRDRLGIPPGKIVLLTVRNLVQRMGLENLVTAMQSVAHRIPEIFLVIGGKGPLQDELARLARRSGIEEHIRFAGFIPERDLPDYYRMADLFILPTRELEGFGLVTVEALACGTPVLGTPVGGTLEILTDLNPDFLFKDTDSESLAEKMIDTCLAIKSDSRFWETTSAQCRKFVEERYSWEHRVRDAESALLEAVGRRSVNRAADEKREDPG